MLLHKVRNYCMTTREAIENGLNIFCYISADYYTTVRFIVISHFCFEPFQSAPRTYFPTCDFRFTLSTTMWPHLSLQQIWKLKQLFRFVRTVQTVECNISHRLEHMLQSDSYWSSQLPDYGQKTLFWDHKWEQLFQYPLITCCTVFPFSSTGFMNPTRSVHLGDYYWSTQSKYWVCWCWYDWRSPSSLNRWYILIIRGLRKDRWNGENKKPDFLASSKSEIPWKIAQNINVYIYIYIYILKFILKSLRCLLDFWQVMRYNVLMMSAVLFRNEIILSWNYVNFLSSPEIHLLSAVDRADCWKRVSYTFEGLRPPTVVSNLLLSKHLVMKWAPAAIPNRPATPPTTPTTVTIVLFPVFLLECFILMDSGPIYFTSTTFPLALTALIETWCISGLRTLTPVNSTVWRISDPKYSGFDELKVMFKTLACIITGAFLM